MKKKSFKRYLVGFIEVMGAGGHDQASCNAFFICWLIFSANSHLTIAQSFANSELERVTEKRLKGSDNA